MIGDFSRGVEHGLAGAKLVLGWPRLWPLVILPFLLSLAALAGAVALALGLRDRWLDALPAWAWLQTAATVLSWILLPIVAYFLFLPLASLIAAPFNEAIAERIEEHVTGRPGPPFSLARLLRELALTLVHETRKFVRWLLLAVGVLFVSLVPVAGPILAVVGGGYLAARFAAWDALDATFSRWGWSYAQKIAFLRARRSLSLGLGTVVALLLVVPVVNALAMPIGAAGGALLAIDATRAARQQ